MRSKYNLFLDPYQISVAIENCDAFGDNYSAKWDCIVRLKEPAALLMRCYCAGKICDAWKQRATSGTFEDFKENCLESGPKESCHFIWNSAMQFLKLTFGSKILAPRARIKQVLLDELGKWSTSTSLIHVFDIS